MNCLNQIILEGNVIKKPVMDGDSASVPIAVTRTFRTSDGCLKAVVSYFDIIGFGSLAGVMETHATRGRGIRVVGRLKQVRYTDDDGKAHSRIVVLAEHIDYMPLEKAKEEK